MAPTLAKSLATGSNLQTKESPIYIQNATEDTQTIKALGKWFVFKPGQIKQMSDDMGLFIAQNKREFGFVSLPDAYEDPEWRTGDEGKAALEAAKTEGQDNYINHLRSVIYNNQVSLRKDLNVANIKADPAAYASKGELHAMRTVAKYQAAKEDTAQKQIDEIKELVKQTGTGK